METDLRFQTVELEKKHLPDIGQSMMIRYKFWNSIGVEGRVLRELFALSYYRMLGWI